MSTAHVPRRFLVSSAWSKSYIIIFIIKCHRCSHADQNMNQVNKFNATDRGEPRPSGQESPLIPYYSRHRKTDRDRKARQHRFSQLKYFWRWNHSEIIKKVTRNPSSPESRRYRPRAKGRRQYLRIYLEFKHICHSKKHICHSKGSLELVKEGQRYRQVYSSNILVTPKYITYRRERVKCSSENPGK